MNEKQGVAYQLTKKRGGKIYKAFVARVVEWILIVLFGGIIGYILGRMNPSPIWPGFLMAILLFITGIMGIVVIISSTIAKLKSNKKWRVLSYATPLALLIIYALATAGAELSFILLPVLYAGIIFFDIQFNKRVIDKGKDTVA